MKRRASMAVCRVNVDAGRRQDAIEKADVIVARGSVQVRHYFLLGTHSQRMHHDT